MSGKHFSGGRKRNSSDEKSTDEPPRKLHVQEVEPTDDVNLVVEDGRTALHRACINNNRDTVQLLLEHNADVSAKDEDGWTALHWAAKINNNNIVQLLVEHNADVSAKDEDGRTPLYWAAENNNHDTVQLLLEHNADVSAKDEDGRTPLFLAAYNNSHDTVQLLLEHNADVSAKDEDGWTALHLAAHNNNHDTVQLLLEHNADVSAKDEDGRTALHLAAKNNNHDTVKMLLEHNADADVKDIHIRSVLYTAATNNDLTFVRRFLKNTVNIDAKCKNDLNGGTLLMSYVLGEIDQLSVDLLRLFVEFGADLCTRTTEGETLIHVMLKHFTFCKPVMMESLTKMVMFLFDEKFKKDLSVKSRDNSGNSPLHVWSQLPNSDESFVLTVGSTLLSRGSLVNAKNDSDQTPLHLARSWCAVDLLLRKGAAKNARDVNGNTPLLARVKRLESGSSFLFDPTNSHEAADKQLRTLFQTGVDPWIENEKCESVFSVLIEKDNIELAQSFVEVFVAMDPTKLNCQNSYGETPLHLACKSTNPESYSLINILLSVSADPTKMNMSKETPLHVVCKKVLEGDASGQPHIWIAGSLLDYGASITMEDAEGHTCLDISMVNDKLKRVLQKPRVTLKPSQFLRWRQTSQQHCFKLSQVSCGQKYRSVETYYFHEDPIGAGAFGEVFAGINKNDGREIALKQIDTRKLKRPEHIREIGSLVKLDLCDQLVRYFNYVEDKHDLFIVLELMEGTLDEYLYVRSDSKYDNVLCNDVMSGLDFLHQQNPPVLHRDIKPGNVLYKIVDRPYLKIADFGLSTKADPNSSESTVGTGSAFAGTKCWMAPEVLDGKVKHSEASDVFASGLVLHEILSNKKHPFAPANVTGMSKERLKIAIVNNILGDKVSIDDRLSLEAQDFINAMLDSNLIKRPHTTAVLEHPFFWSSIKKLRFLSAVGSQPAIEAPSHSRTPNPVRDDLENGLGKQFITNPWNGPISAIYKQVTASPKSRKYDTSSAVSLLRFVRNTLAHVSDQSNPTGMKEVLLEKFEFLQKFPPLLMEVYKVVIRHGWDKEKEIQYVMTETVV